MDDPEIVHSVGNSHRRYVALNSSLQEQPQTEHQSSYSRGGIVVNVNTSSSDDGDEFQTAGRRGSWRCCRCTNFTYASAALLCLVNLLNYADRSAVAAVLHRIKSKFNQDYFSGGLLQTCFILSYMVLCPIFGYLGDRGHPGNLLFSRKGIMLLGITLWSGVSLASSFVPESLFGLLLLSRSLVGIGEASYATVSTPIIADLFSGNARTWALIVFNLQIPLGSGLGYVAGHLVSEATDTWNWALRVTPPLGLLCVPVLVALFKEPLRGQSGGPAAVAAAAHRSRWQDDLRALGSNPSFVSSTLGLSAVCFVCGALSLWAPELLRLSVLSREGSQSESSGTTLVFGGLTCAAGICGVASGTELARRLRPRTARADPLVCAGGLLISVPLLMATMLTVRSHLYLAYVLLFLGEMAVFSNWALVMDILMRVCHPGQRATATGLSTLCSHLLGDAASPVIVGWLTDRLKHGQSDSAYLQFVTLRRSLYICLFLLVAGAAGFLACAVRYPDDCRLVSQIEEAALLASGADSDSGDTFGIAEDRPLTGANLA